MADNFQFPEWFTTDKAPDEYSRRVTLATRNILEETDARIIIDTTKMVINPHDLVFLDLPFAFILYKLLTHKEVNFPIWDIDDQELQINMRLLKFLFPKDFLAIHSTRANGGSNHSHSSSPSHDKHQKQVDARRSNQDVRSSADMHDPAEGFVPEFERANYDVQSRLYPASQNHVPSRSNRLKNTGADQERHDFPNQPSTRNPFRTSPLAPH